MNGSCKLRSERRKTALEGLALLVKGPRPVVARAFDDVVAAKGQGGAVSLEAIAGDVVSDTTAYMQALQRADVEGWLKELCIELIQVDAVDARFSEQARDLFGDADEVPQATFDAYNVSHDPCVNGRRQLQAAPQLCRIDIDGNAAGTGFLVRPHLVLTGYHVVALLIGEGKSLAGSHQRLSIVFDDRRDLRGSVVTRLPGVPVGVPKDWLVDWSRCLPLEQVGVNSDDDSYVEQIDPNDGPWDYALIRLEKIVSLACNGLPLGTLGIRKDQPIIVYHHPRGKTLVGTPGTVVGVLGQGVRFRHTANTKDGSSGGPCFNTEYEVVGIHQAGPRVPLKSKSGVPNRGIPIHPIRGKIAAKLQDPPPELKTIVALDTGHIVIGRDDTQQWIWRAVPKDGPVPPGAGNKILVVKGAEGRGKKLTLEILRTLLRGGAHMITDLDAGNMVEDTPLTFARKLLIALNADEAGLTPNKGDTNDMNWIKLTLMKELRRAIDSVRDGRTVWIGLRYPKDGVLPQGSKIRPTLDAFYAQVKEVEWLRLVLLGLRVDVPYEVLDETTPETLTPLNADHVVNYFQRRWTEKGEFADKSIMEILANELVAAAWGPEESPSADYHRKLMARIRECETKLGARLK